MPQDDVMFGVAGRVQDARPSGVPEAGAPGAAMARMREATEGEALNRLRSFVHVQPLTIVLGAAAAGLLAGLALGRRRG